MLRDRYDPMNLFTLVPALRFAMEPILARLDMGYKWSLRQGTDQERQEWGQRRLGSQVARCTLQYFKHSPYDSLDTPLTLRYGFTASRFVTVAGNLAFFRPNVLNTWTHSPFTDTKRTLPVFYQYPWTEVDSLAFRLPSTYRVDELPQPVSLETRFGRFQTSYTVQGETLIYTRVLSLTQREVPPADYPTLKAFYETVIRSDKAQVVLKSAPTATRP